MNCLKIKQEKGITLIALVVTIIVLLILAGVAIRTLFGDNSLLGTSKNAEETFSTAKEEETVSLVVNHSYNNKGNLDLEQVKAGIRKELPTATIEEGESSIIVTGKYKTYEINANGNLEKSLVGDKVYLIKNGIDQTTLTRWMADIIHTQVHLPI